MTREQIKAMLPDGTEDAVVTKILDALHGEIQPHKDAAKKAQDDLAAKVAELAEARRPRNWSLAVCWMDCFGRRAHVP